MEDILPLTVITLILLAMVGWVLWRRSRQKSEARVPLTGPPKTLAEISRFGEEVRAAKSRQQQVLRDGRPAPAQVLTLEETGVNEHDWDEDDDEPFDPQQARPHVRLQLLVQPADQPSFEVEVVCFVTREKLAELRSVQPVAVRYVADGPERVALA